MTGSLAIMHPSRSRLQAQLEADGRRITWRRDDKPRDSIIQAHLRVNCVLRDKPHGLDRGLLIGVNYIDCRKLLI